MVCGFKICLYIESLSSVFLELSENEFEVIFNVREDLNWKVKKIVVNPYQSLSLQMHEYRTEHWIVLKGKAQVEINGKTSYLIENQSTYIPLKSKHRIFNNESNSLVLIEVQCGKSVEESDIIRFEDKYGRLNI